MKSAIYVTATWLSLGLIGAVVVASTLPHSTKYQKPTFDQRFSDWRRSENIEDRRDDAALREDMAPAGWAVYHRNH